MTRPSIRILIVALLAAGFALGLLPPAGGSGPPETMLSTVPLHEAELAGRGLLASGQALSATRTSRTPRHEVCADFAFTAVGLTWRQTGDELVPVSFRWDEGSGVRGVAVYADPDHAPDPGTGERARGGTPLVWTGEARCVELTLELQAGVEVRDLRAVFVNTSGTSREGSILGTIATGIGRGMALLWGMETSEAVAPKPKIIRRSGWGANESLRNCGPSYAPELKMAYVHHTASGNGYSKAQADDVIRAIYAYHTQGRGYCDIAYNFLVDRFGRIYEGRFGGMTEPVIGGHAMGFNTGSTGVAVVGNFVSVNPGTAAISALKRLLAWRLDIAHLNPKGTATMVSAGGPNQKYEEGEEVKLPVIAGHRHTGYTTCPGDRLFAKLGAIRTGAQARGLPKIWNPRATSDTLELGHGGVRYRAKLSAALPWSVEIAGPSGIVRTWTGTGQGVDVVWEGFDDRGFPADEADYIVTMRAGGAGQPQARPAALRTALTGSCDITTTRSSPTAIGTDEDEVLCGLNGQADVLDGGGGNDILMGFGGNDQLTGGPGQDTLVGGNGSDMLQGGTGADVLFGGAANDTLVGGANADVLHGGPGDDQLDGGGGADTVSHATSSTAVRVDLAAGTAIGEGTDDLTGFVNAIGSPRNDTLIGSDGHNHLVGGGGRDVLTGGAGDDLLEAGPGADRLAGGAGDDALVGGGGSDTARFAGAPGPVVVDLRAGSAIGDGADTLRAIQNVVGGPGKDTLRGDAKANRLLGKGGWDILVGKGGPDLLVGGAGRDDLRGGSGRDTLRAKDGKRDSVDGGGGFDAAHVDPKDDVRRVEQHR
ncbi:MAG TPA: N-acetylmuramoyl-L-alanine amidase [Actinomycetota bacterium]